MEKKEQIKWPLDKRLCIIFLIAAAFILCLLLAAGIGNETDIELLLTGVHDDRLVMLLENSGKLCAYYKDLSDPDSALTKADKILEDGYTFFIDGGKLGVAESLKDELDIIIYPFDKDFVSDEYCMFGYNPIKGDKLVFANTSDTENIYIMYILSADKNLRYCESNSEPEDKIIFNDVGFLGSTQGGWVYAYAGETLLRWTGSGFDSCTKYEGLPCPERLIGENAYMDKDGMIVKITGEAPEMIDLNFNGINHDICFGCDEYIIAADSMDVLHKFDWSGEEITEVGTAMRDGRMLGVINDYLIFEKGGQLCLEQLVFKKPDDGTGDETDPTSTPTPSPVPDETDEPTPSPGEGDGEFTPTPETTPEPTSEPTPTPTPLPTDKSDEVGKLIEEIQFKELTGENGRYAAMLAGARVANLRDIYWPQSIEAYTQDGKPVYESLLKTGMKIRIPLEDGKSEEISVIIRGDCDGDGRVRKSDITFASLYIINAAYAETDVQFMAMDMNDDGKVDIWDLPMIADEIKRTE